jgi:pyrroline-5-carboxylate reductase
MKQKRIGIIGIGNMGGAIASSLVKPLACFTVALYDKSREKLNSFTVSGNSKNCEEPQNLKKAESLPALAELSDTIIFAVKPQDIEELLQEAGALFKNKNIITIIAGKPIELFAKYLQTDNICRYMPNIAALCGKSATALSFNKNADKNFMDDALEIANSFGSAFIIPEKLLSAFTGLSGSGIAFVYQFIHALAMGGVTAGIHYKESLDISLVVLDGAVKSIHESGKNPMDLVTKVSSPAGTTIAGLQILESSSFNSAVMEAVFAASKRAKEIEKEKL